MIDYCGDFPLPAEPRLYGALRSLPFWRAIMEVKEAKRKLFCQEVGCALEGRLPHIPTLLDFALISWGVNRSG